MPPDIAQLFHNEYKIDKEAVISNVYQKSSPNSYLASFARFLSTIKTTAYGQAQITAGLQEFIDSNIKSYPQHTRYKCHFVGSIAYIFADELHSLCNANSIQVGKIIKQPISDLLHFILNRKEP